MGYAQTTFPMGFYSHGLQKLKLQVEDVIKQFIAGEQDIDLDNKTTNNLTRFELVADASDATTAVSHILEFLPMFILF